MGASNPSPSAAPERGSLILHYAPADARAGLAALLDLDAQLGAILRTTRQPMVGQMRLTWWFEALTRLDSASPPAEPVLGALAAEVLTRAVRGAMLAAMIDGWEVLLGDDPLDDALLATYAAGRGGVLFRAMGRVVDAAPGDPVAAAGEAWALFDLARHVRDPATAGRATALAGSRLAAVRGVRWSRRARALGAMLIVATRPDAGPGIVPRLLWHRLTGR